MLLLKDLSFRHKIPLRGSVLVLVTAMLLTTVLGYREQDELRRDLRENANLLAKTLSQNLIGPVLQEDVWRAFELVRTPVLGQDSRERQRLPIAVVLFDRDARVFASSDPSKYRVLTSPEDIPEIGAFAPWIRGDANPGSELIDSGGEALAVISEVKSDGVTLGHLVLAYSRAALRERIANLVGKSIAYTLGLLALLLPITWYWGLRMAHPLTSLADGMAIVGKRIPDDSELHLDESNDEIGQAGSAFRKMLVELRRKSALEKEIILNERLAATGRMAAGVAHEINNPLGGMLNALDTYKRHGGDATVTNKTLSLIERGLIQIRDTVSALLVEVRPSGKPLTASDFEDVRTLLAQDIADRQATVEWSVAVNEPEIPLPAALVRQILFNLLKNALQAIDTGGTVRVNAEANDFIMNITVANQGRPIPPDRMSILFEPFATSRADGHGLGLWVSYQIVQQLHGRINVSSDPDWTVFSIALPR